MLKKAFTLIELLVVIAIIAILAAILFPVFAQARESARKTVCLSNIKEMGLGMMMYTQDYDEKMVIWEQGSGNLFWDSQGYAMSYDRLLQPYLKNNLISGCPSDLSVAKPLSSGAPYPPVTAYAVRSFAIPGNIGGNWCNTATNPQPNPPALAQIPEPAITIGLNERDNCASATATDWGWCSINDSESETAWRHNQQGNFVYVDGHAKSTHYDQDGLMGVSEGGHSEAAGLHKFPGYDWSHTDGSLWGAWNVLPGGSSLIPDDAADVSCGPPAVDIPGSQIN